MPVEIDNSNMYDSLTYQSRNITLEKDVFVNEAWSSKQDGETIVIDGKEYTIGLNAFAKIEDAVPMVADDGSISVLGSAYSSPVDFRAFYGDTANKKILTDLTLTVATTAGRETDINVTGANKFFLFSLSPIATKNSPAAFHFPDFNEKFTATLTDSKYAYTGLISAHNPADIIMDKFSGSINLNYLQSSETQILDGAGNPAPKPQYYFSALHATKGNVALGEMTGSIHTDMVYTKENSERDYNVEHSAIRAALKITVDDFSGSITSALHGKREPEGTNGIYARSYGLHSTDGAAAGIIFNNTIFTGNISASVDGTAYWSIAYALKAYNEFDGNLTMKAGSTISASVNVDRLALAYGFYLDENKPGFGNWNANLIIEAGASVQASAISTTLEYEAAYGIFIGNQLAGNITVAGTLSALVSPVTEDSACAIYATQLGGDSTYYITIGNDDGASTSNAIIDGDIYIGYRTGYDKKGVLNLIGRSQFNGSFQGGNYVVNFKAGYAAGNVFQGDITAYSMNVEAGVNATVGGSITVSEMTLADTAALNLTAGNLIAFSGVWGSTGAITITISDESILAYKLVDFTGTGSMTLANYGNVSLKSNTAYQLVVLDNDLYASNVDLSTLYVNDAWSTSAVGEEVETGKYYGFNAFATLPLTSGKIDSAITKDIEILAGAGSATADGTNNLILSGNENFTLTNQASESGAYQFYMLKGISSQYNGTEATSAYTITLAQSNFDIYAIYSANGSVVTIDGTKINQGETGWVKDSYLNIYGGTVNIQNGSNVLYCNINITGGLNVTGNRTVVGEYNDTIDLRLVNLSEFAGAGNVSITKGAVVEAQNISLGQVQATQHKYKDNVFGTDISQFTLNASQLKGTDRTRYSSWYVNPGILVGTDAYSASFTAENSSLVKDFAVVKIGALGSFTLKDSTMTMVNYVVDYQTQTPAEFTNAGTMLIANSNLEVGTMTNSGEIKFTGNSVLTAGTINISVDSSVTMDSSSMLAFSTAFANSGSISVDMTGATKGVYKLIDSKDVAMQLSSYGSVVLKNNTTYNMVVVDNDLFASNVELSTLYVNAAWSTFAVGAEVETGKFYGFNAFASADSAATAVPENLDYSNGLLTLKKDSLDGKITGLSGLNIQENTTLSGSIETTTASNLTIDGTFQGEALLADGLHTIAIGANASLSNKNQTTMFKSATGQVHFTKLGGILTLTTKEMPIQPIALMEINGGAISIDEFTADVSIDTNNNDVLGAGIIANATKSPSLSIGNYAGKIQVAGDVPSYGFYVGNDGTTIANKATGTIAFHADKFDGTLNVTSDLGYAYGISTYAFGVAKLEIGSGSSAASIHVTGVNQVYALRSVNTGNTTGFSSSVSISDFAGAIRAHLNAEANPKNQQSGYGIYNYSYAAGSVELKNFSGLLSVTGSGVFQKSLDAMSPLLAGIYSSEATSLTNFSGQLIVNQNATEIVNQSTSVGLYILDNLTLDNFTGTIYSGRYTGNDLEEQVKNLQSANAETRQSAFDKLSPNLGTAAILTGGGVSNLTFNDGAVVMGTIQLHKGDDSITINGENTLFYGGTISMMEGNDTLTITGGQVIGTLNGGSGTDTLIFGAADKKYSGTIDKVTAFENITFKSGSSIVIRSGKTMAFTDGNVSIDLADSYLENGKYQIVSGATTYSNVTYTINGELAAVNNPFLFGGKYLVLSAADDGLSISETSFVDTKETIYVDASWASAKTGELVTAPDGKNYIIGTNAFSDVAKAFDSQAAETQNIKLTGDHSVITDSDGKVAEKRNFNVRVTGNYTIGTAEGTTASTLKFIVKESLWTGGGSTLEVGELAFFSVSDESRATVTIDAGVTIETNAKLWFGRSAVTKEVHATDFVINGNIIQQSVDKTYGIMQIQIDKGSTLLLNGSMSLDWCLAVKGSQFTVSSTGELKKSQNSGANTSLEVSARDEAAGKFIVDGSKKVALNELKVFANSSVELKNGAEVSFDTATVEAQGSFDMKTGSTLTVGQFKIDAAGSMTVSNSSVTVTGAFNTKGAWTLSDGAKFYTAQGTNKTWTELWNSVNISGENTLWNHGYMVALKEGATLNISGKAVVDLGYLAAGGSIIIDDATLNLGNAAGDAKNNFGGYAAGLPLTTVTLQNGAKLTSSNGLNIGHRGGSAEEVASDPNFSKDAKVYVNSGSTLTVTGDVLRVGASAITNPSSGCGELFIDNATVNAAAGLKVGGFRMNGKGGEGRVEITNGGSLTAGASEIGGISDSASLDGIGRFFVKGIDSVFKADSLTIGVNGSGMVSLSNGASITVNGDVTIGAKGALSMDFASTFSFSGAFSSEGVGMIYVDMRNATEARYKIIDYTGSGTVAGYGNVVFSGSSYGYVAAVIDNDLYVAQVKSDILVNSTYTADNVPEGYTFGLDAFNTLADGLKMGAASGMNVIVNGGTFTGDMTVTDQVKVTIKPGVTIEGVLTFTANGSILYVDAQANLSAPIVMTGGTAYLTDTVLQRMRMARLSSGTPLNVSSIVTGAGAVVIQSGDWVLDKASTSVQDVAVENGTLLIKSDADLPKTITVGTSTTRGSVTYEGNLVNVADGDTMTIGVQPGSSLTTTSGDPLEIKVADNANVTIRIEGLPDDSSDIKITGGAGTSKINLVVDSTVDTSKITTDPGTDVSIKVKVEWPDGFPPAAPAEVDLLKINSNEAAFSLSDLDKFSGALMNEKHDINIYAGGVKQLGNNGATNYLYLNNFECKWLFGGSNAWDTPNNGSNLFVEESSGVVVYGGGEAIMFHGSVSGASLLYAKTYVKNSDYNTIVGGGRGTGADVRIVNLTVDGGRGRIIYGGGYGANATTVTLEIKGGADIDLAYGGGSAGNVDTVTFTISGKDTVVYKVYGGGAGSVTVGNVTLDIIDKAFVARVYGGGDSEDHVITGDVNILVTDASVGNVLYGAGRSRVDGTVNVTLQNGAVVNELYGGAYSSTGPADGFFKVNKIVIGISYSTLSFVYGGGRMTLTDETTDTHIAEVSDVAMTLGNGTVVNNTIYGGGFVNSTMQESLLGGFKIGSITVNMEGNAKGNASLVGGTYLTNGSAETDTIVVNFNGGTIASGIYGGDFVSGTRGLNATSRIASTTVNMNVSSNAVIFGGSIASVGSATVTNSTITVAAGVVLGTVYAGGNGAKTTVVNSSVVLKNGATVSNLSASGYGGGVISNFNLMFDGGMDNTTVTLDLAGLSNAKVSFRDMTGTTDWNNKIIKNGSFSKVEVLGNSNLTVTGDNLALTELCFTVNASTVAGSASAMLSFAAGVSLAAVDTVTVTLDQTGSGTYLLLDNVNSLNAVNYTINGVTALLNGGFVFVGDYKVQLVKTASDALSMTVENNYTFLVDSTLGTDPVIYQGKVYKPGVNAYKTLAEAEAAAASGNIIILKTAEAGNFTSQKTLTLQNDATGIPGGAAYGFSGTLAADNVTLSGTGTYGINVQRTSGVFMANGTNVELTGMTGTAKAYASGVSGTTVANAKLQMATNCEINGSLIGVASGASVSGTVYVQADNVAGTQSSVDYTVLGVEGNGTVGTVRTDVNTNVVLTVEQRCKNPNKMTTSGLAAGMGSGNKIYGSTSVKLLLTTLVVNKDDDSRVPDILVGGICGGDGNNEIYGNTAVSIANSSVSLTVKDLGGNIIGGGSGKIYGDSSVAIIGDEVKLKGGSIIGGSDRNGTVENSFVRLIGGTITIEQGVNSTEDDGIFGGSYGKTSGDDIAGVTTGNTQVVIGGAMVNANIYAGSQGSDVGGNAVVELGNGSFNGNIDGMKDHVTGTSSLTLYDTVIGAGSKISAFDLVELNQNGLDFSAVDITDITNLKFGSSVTNATFGTIQFDDIGSTLDFGSGTFKANRIEMGAGNDTVKIQSDATLTADLDFGSGNDTFEVIGKTDGSTFVLDGSSITSSGNLTLKMGALNRGGEGRTIGSSILEISNVDYSSMSLSVTLDATQIGQYSAQGSADYTIALIKGAMPAALTVVNITVGSQNVHLNVDGNGGQLLTGTDTKNWYLWTADTNGDSTFDTLVLSNYAKDSVAGRMASSLSSFNNDSENRLKNGALVG